MNEVPKLPQGWAWTSLGQLISDGPQNGIYLPQSSYGAGVPILRIEDYQNGTSHQSSELKKVAASEEDASKYALRIGDLVINRVNSPSHLGKCLSIKMRNLPAIFESNMMRVRLHAVINPTYIERYLHSSSGRLRLTNNAKWAVNQASINQEDVKNTPIPLAPLTEQRRIVETIEQQFTRLDAGVAALKRAKAALKRYRAAVLKAAVEGTLTAAWRAEHPDVETATDLLQRILAERRAKWEADVQAKGKDPVNTRYVAPEVPDTGNLPELPEGWCWATVGQLATQIRNGLSPKPDPEPPGHRILRINAVRPMKVNMDEIRYLRMPIEEVRQYIIQDGDILFTRYNGSLDLLGVAGMVRGNAQPTLHPDKLIRVQMNQQGILPAYLELASNTGCSRMHIESRARTTAGQTGISGTDIKQMPLPLPSLAEQEQIVAEVEKRLSIVSELEETVETNLKRADRLRQSILEQAFAGNLVPQCPDDEPASVLLKRIREQREGPKSNGRSSHRDAVFTAQATLWDEE